MQKEILVAISFGSLLGLGGAFAIWKANSPTSPAPSPLVTLLTTSSPAPHTTNQEPTENTDATGFMISSPSKNIFATNNANLKISGNAPENSFVVITTDEDIVIPLEDVSQFTEEITLKGGINQISVANVHSDNSQKTILKSAIYSSQLTENSEASVFTGSITDISEGNIQIRNSDGQIQQVSVNSETSYVNTVATAKDIEFADLAIGDFIAAIGTLNRQTLTGQRIIVSTPPKAPDYKITYGTIKNLTRTTLTSSNNETFTINANTDLTPTKLPTAAVAIDKNFIAVTTPDSKALRTLYIVD